MFGRSFLSLFVLENETTYSGGRFYPYSYLGLRLHVREVVFILIRAQDYDCMFGRSFFFFLFPTPLAFCAPAGSSIVSHRRRQPLHHPRLLLFPPSASLLQSSAIQQKKEGGRRKKKQQWGGRREDVKEKKGD